MMEHGYRLAKEYARLYTLYLFSVYAECILRKPKMVDLGKDVQML